MTLPALEPLFQIVAELLIKSVAVFLLALVFDRLLVRTPSSKAALWRSAYGALILLPVLQQVLPETPVVLFKIPHAGISAPDEGRTAALFLLVWAIGVGLGLVRIGADWMSANRVVHRSRKCNGSCFPALRQEISALNRHANVDFRSSTEISSPAAYGWRHPVVLFPVEASGWSDEQMRAAVLHEMEHLRRFDWPLMLLERVTRVFYWPNILLKIAHRSSSLAREMLADQAVLRGDIASETYAAQLIQLSRAIQPVARPFFVSMSQSGVEQRLRAVFSERHQVQTGSRGLRVLAVIIAFAATGMIAAAETWVCVPRTASPETTSCS